MLMSIALPDSRALLRLTLASAENALFGAVIAERQRDRDSVKSCRQALPAELKKLP